MGKVKQVYDKLFSKLTWMNPRLCSHIVPLSMPLVKGKGVLQSYFIFNGSTCRLPSLGAHASVLSRGQRPHPVHSHQEEEILVLLAGKLDLVLPDAKSPGGERLVHLKPYQMLYYPSHFEHTLQASVDEDAHYIMLKWETDTQQKVESLAFGHFDILELNNAEISSKGFVPQCIFEGPTSTLKKLRAHRSTLSPGAGYAPHADDYDVVIIVLEGEVETLGKRARPYDVIYYAAKDPHGMHNPGNKTATYLVFEFHGRSFVVIRRLLKRLSLFFNKMKRKCQKA